MSMSPKPGELLVGSYLRLVIGCELVTYNQHSLKQGDQNEIDVIAVNTSDKGKKTVYSCEVVTHLNGIGYGNYQESFERLEKKFTHHKEEIENLFDSVDEYRYQLWSPNVQPGLTDRLPKLADVFEEDDTMELELITNEIYAGKIDELRNEAASTTAQYGETAFRILQILEHLSDSSESRV